MSSSSEVRFLLFLLSDFLKKKQEERDDFGEEEEEQSGNESYAYESNDVVCPNADCKGAELEADFEQGYYVCTNCGYIPAHRAVYEDDVLQSLKGQHKQKEVAAFLALHPELKNSAVETSSSVPKGLGGAQKQAESIQKQLTEAFRESVSRRIEAILRDLVKRVGGIPDAAAVVTEAHALAIRFIRPLEAQRLQKRMTVIETKEADLALIMCCRVCWKDVPGGAYKLDGCECTLCDKCKPPAANEAPAEKMSWEEIIKLPRPPQPPEHSCRAKQAFNKTKEIHRATSRPTVTAFSAIAAACIVLVGERRGISPRSQALCAAVTKKTLRKDNLRSWVRRIREALELHPEPDLVGRISGIANWYAVGCTPTERKDNKLLVWYLLQTEEERPRPPWLSPVSVGNLTVEDVDGRLTTLLHYLRWHHSSSSTMDSSVPANKSAWMIAAVVAYLRMRLREGAGEDIEGFTARIGVTTARFQACKAELVQLI